MFWSPVRRPFSLWKNWRNFEDLHSHFNLLTGGNEVMKNEKTTDVSKTAENTSRPLPVYRPSYSLWENDNEFFVSVEMPGVNEKAVEIDLQGKSLVISATVENYLPEEFSADKQASASHKYERSFRLSDSIDSESIKAVMKDGVLRLTLPKAKAAVNRKIEVVSA
mgnify:CR=1 FL=1